MISWIIILALVVLAIFVVKIKYVKHKIFIIVLIILVLFVYGSLSLINVNYDLKTNSTENLLESANIYYSWLGNAFNNVKLITGKIISLNWTSLDKNISTNKINNTLKYFEKIEK